MADITRKITLPEFSPPEAGPNFSVQYSIDCIDYVQSVDCTNVSLPSPGSFVYCTIDSDAACIRLTPVPDTTTP